MVMLSQKGHNMNLEIRYNGRLDYKRMIAIRAKHLGNKIDYFFVNHEWPKEDTA